MRALGELYPYRGRLAKDRGLGPDPSFHCEREVGFAAPEQTFLFIGSDFVGDRPAARRSSAQPSRGAPRPNRGRSPQCAPKSGSATRAHSSVYRQSRADRGEIGAYEQERLLRGGEAYFALAME
jgi:hypothetical protein